MVLVDGNGALFHDSLIRAQRGGFRAARMLEGAVQEVLGEDSMPILVRVYANVDELARSLCAAKLVGSEAELHRFSKQFTKSRPGFDFVNVGYEKGNASSKMRRGSSKRSLEQTKSPC